MARKFSLLGRSSFNITAPYGAVESWVYDRFIAPAALELKKKVDDLVAKEIPREGHILEVGCGGGQMAADLLHTYPKIRLTALDLSLDQARRARRRTRSQADRIKVLRASALDLPFASGAFDAVYSSASIKHWPDPRRGLRECIRVLKPRGHLLVFEVDRGCSLEDARRFVGMWKFPSFLGWPSLLLFRTYVAGLGLDLDETRNWMSDLRVSRYDVRRIPGTPALLLLAQAKG